MLRDPLTQIVPPEDANNPECPSCNVRSPRAGRSYTKHAAHCCAQNGPKRFGSAREYGYSGYKVWMNSLRLLLPRKTPPLDFGGCQSVQGWALFGRVYDAAGALTRLAEQELWAIWRGEN